MMFELVYARMFELVPVCVYEVFEYVWLCVWGVDDYVCEVYDYVCMTTFVWICVSEYILAFGYVCIWCD